jgi:hypothetical protein
MSEHERDQQSDAPEEGEETVQDLDVPEGEAEDVKGGQKGEDDNIISV